MRAFYLILLCLSGLFFQTSSSARTDDSLSPPPSSAIIKQELVYADKIYAEGKIIYARPVYMKYRTALSTEQKGRLGFSLLQSDCDSSELRLGFNLTQEAYTSGDKTVTAFLGWLHYIGRGTTRDTTKGLAMLAAVEEDKEGWVDYFKGYRMRMHENYPEALAYLKKAAKSDNIFAMNEIGLLYQDGYPGQKRDYEKAAEWFSKAAQKGSGSAYALWGWLCYRADKDLKRNYGLAFENFSKAQVYGDPEHSSELGLGHCYSFGIHVQKNLDSAFFYYRLAGKYREGRGYSRIGYIYENGVGIGQDADSAIYNYARGAALKDAWACYRLSKIFSEGVLVPRNDTLALNAVKAGILLDDLNCLLEYAHYCKKGIGIEKNLQKSKEILSIPELVKTVPALCALGDIEDELGNEKEAIVYFKSAADKGSTNALFKIAKIYKRHIKDEGNTKQYDKWLNAAVDAGDADAAFSIAMEYLRGDNRVVDTLKGSTFLGLALSKKSKDAQDLVALFGSKVSKFPITIDENQDKDYTVDYEPPSSLIAEAAMAGSREDQYLMGLKYFRGVGVKRNYSLAIQWFQQAAAQGHPDSYFQLGYMHASGLGFSQSYTDAMTWYELAAAKGVAIAINNIGALYYNGKGVHLDKAKAATYYEKAAELGEPLAQANLGYYLIYDCSPDPQKIKRGKELIVKSAEAQNATGQFILSGFYLKGELLGKNDSLSEVWMKRAADQNKIEAMMWMARQYYIRNRADTNARNLFVRIAMQGKEPLQLALLYDIYKIKNTIAKAEEEKILAGLLANKNNLNKWDKIALIEFYRLGIGTEPDWDKAIALALDLERANENVDVELELARLFSVKPVPDYEEAVKWCRKAAAKDGEDVVYRIGEYYSIGKRMLAYNNLVYYYFKGEAERGNLKAVRYLAYVYQTGIGVPTDMKQAIFWFEEAARTNDVVAMEELARLYLIGEEVPKDANKEKFWMEKAASAGSISAGGYLAWQYMNSKNKEEQEQCIYWYEKLVAQGDPTSMNNLGECYYTGIGVKVDYEKAIYYYQMAIDHKSAWGKLSLGTLYLNGHGVPKDEAKARELYQSACDENLKEACEELAKLDKKN